MERYILGIDQSTQGTKALLFDRQGALIARADLSHRQIIDNNGWVEHDPEEIYRNTIQTVKNVVEKAGIDKNLIAARASATRGRLPLPGKRTADRYITPWYGSVPGERRSAAGSQTVPV